MVSIQDVKEYDQLDATQMKMMLVAYKTESIQQKMTIDRLTAERNALFLKISGVQLTDSFKGVPQVSTPDQRQQQPPRPPQQQPSAPRPQQPMPRPPQ